MGACRDGKPRNDNSRITRWRARAVGLIAAMAASIASGQIDARASDATISKPAYSLEEAQRWVGEVLPHVEHAADRKFTTPTTLKLVTRDELAKALLRDIEIVSGKDVSPDPDEADRNTDLSKASEVMSAALLGKYSLSEQAVLLPPENIRPMFKQFDIAETDIEAVMRLVIAHEITHALQDQHVDLRKTIAKYDKPSDVAALSAAIEGFALVIQDKVAERMNLSDSRRALDRILPGRDATPRANASAGPLPEAVIDIVAGSYTAGRSVMSMIFDRDGARGIWDALDSPAVALKTVVAPRSTSGRMDRPGYVDALAGLEEPLGKTWANVQNASASGEEGMRFFQSLDEDARGDVRNMIEYVHSYARSSRSSGGPPQAFAVTAYRLTDPKMASAFDARIREAASRIKSTLTAGGAVSVRLHEEKVESPIAADCMTWTFSVKDEPPARLSIAWAMAGRHCIQLITSVETNTSKCVDILATAAARLDKIPN